MKKIPVAADDLSETSSFSNPNFQKDLTININQGDTLSKILRKIDGGSYMLIKLWRFYFE